VFIFMAMALSVAILTLGFCIEGRISRRQRALGFIMTETDKKKRAFLRWNVIMSITFVMHSVLVVNPTDLPAFSQSLLNLLSLDITCVINTFHGLFLVAVGVRFVISRKTLYYYVIILLYSFICISSFFVIILSITRATIPAAHTSNDVSIVTIICLLLSLAQFFICIGALNFSIRLKDAVDYQDYISLGGSHHVAKSSVLKSQKITTLSVYLECVLFVMYLTIILDFHQI